MSVIAIVHPTGLLGTEIRETLDRRHELWREIRLYSDREDEIGSLTEIGGSAAMVNRPISRPTSFFVVWEANKPASVF